MYSSGIVSTVWPEYDGTSTSVLTKLLVRLKERILKDWSSIIDASQIATYDASNEISLFRVPIACLLKFWMKIMNLPGISKWSYLTIPKIQTKIRNGYNDVGGNIMLSQICDRSSVTIILKLSLISLVTNKNIIPSLVYIDYRKELYQAFTIILIH